MKKVGLTQGKCALVDDKDFEMLSQWKWYYAQGYAARKVRNDRKQIVVFMHRDVIGAKIGEITDHINRNKLDNRRDNLRLVTKSQNCRNIGKRGYYLDKKSNKWMAYIRINRKLKYIGRYSTEVDARKAYLVEYNKCFV